MVRPPKITGDDSRDKGGNTKIHNYIKRGLLMECGGRRNLG